jgi:hypothetical protein
MRVPARAFREFFGVAVVNEDVVSSGDQVRRKDVAHAAKSDDTDPEGWCKNIRSAARSRKTAALFRFILEARKEEAIVTLPTLPLGRSGLNITPVGFGSWAVAAASMHGWTRSSRVSGLRRTLAR